MRTTQSGHEWHVDEDGDVSVAIGPHTPVYLDELDLVRMLRQVRIDRMARKVLEDRKSQVIANGVSNS